MKSFKLYNGKRDKFSLRKKSVGLVSVAIATLAMYGIVGGSQTVQADEQSSMNSQVTSVSDSSEKTETEKAVVPTPISEDASSVSSSSVSENEIMDAAQSVSGLQSSSTESTSSEDSSPSSSNSSSTEEESSKPSPTPSQSETTPKTEETNTAPQTRAARSRRSVTEALSQISDFKVTVTTKDGETMTAGSSKDLSGQEISLDKIQMNFKIKQDGSLKTGDKIRIPVKLENNAYAAYYANLGPGTTETIAGVGTIRFDFSKKDNLAYEITISSEFGSLQSGQEKTVAVNLSAANGAKFTAQKSNSNIVLTINNSTFIFKPVQRTFPKLEGNFAVYNGASSDSANSIKIGTSTGDANYYNSMLSSNGQILGNTNIPKGDIISIHRIKPENGSKIIKIKPEPHRITSTLAISEDGQYIVRNDTPTSIAITNESENKLIKLAPKSTDADILKALKQEGKNSTAVIDNGDGSYTIATNLGKMIGEGATTYHDIWPTDDYGTFGDQYQEIDRSNEVNAKVNAILAKTSVIQGTGHSTRITFADSSINNTITGDSKSYSVDDDGTENEIRSEKINAVTKPSNARSQGQAKITIQYVDTNGNQVATQTYQYGYPGGTLHPQSPNYNAQPQSITGYTLVTTSNPISSVSGTQLIADKSIAFTNTDQVYYYVYSANKSSAKVTYIDDTDGGKVLEAKELTGDYNTTDSYRTKDTIESYEKKGYEFVSDDYPANGVTYNETLQTFEVHLKHKKTSITEEKTVKETIHYTYEGGAPAAPDHTSSLKFTRTATTDLVTNVTTGDWTAENGTSFAAVTSPTIKGYTPDLAEVPAVDNITADSPNIEKTVVYKANPASAKVTYIDDTTGETLETKDLNGFLGQTDPYRTAETIKKYTDKNYKLVSDNYPTNGVTYNETLQTFEVRLSHKVALVKETKTVTETIKYVYEDNTEAAATKVQTLDFERINMKDLVTNEILLNGPWLPSTETFPEVVSPKVDGYTPDKATVAAVEQITGDSADIEETVTYKADKQKVTYTIIDDTAQKTLKDKEVLTSGGSDTPLPDSAREKYDLMVNAYLAQGYELVSKEQLPAKFDLDSNHDQNVVVHLKHGTTDIQESKDVNLTVRYHGAGGQTPEDKVQTATWTRTVTKDKITGTEVSATPWTSDKANYDAVPSPVIPGYSVDIETVPAETVTQENIVKDVHYTIQTQKVTYTVLDEITGQTLENQVELTTGDSGVALPAAAKTKYDTIVAGYLAQGYEVASKDELPAQFDTDSSVDQNVVIRLKHKVSTSTETKTVTQTINYVYEDDNTPAAPEKKTTLTFSREVKTDEVTKDVTPGVWAPSTGTFPEVVSPTVDGYTPDKAKVDAENVTADQADIKVTVKYKTDKQKVTYTIIDDTTNTTLEDKKELTSGNSDTPLPNGTEAKYDSIVAAYLAQGYELVSKDQLPAKFDLDSSYDQNVVVHVKHGTTESQESKSVNLTVRYHGAGGQTPADQVQIATWTRTVTTDKVTGQSVSTTAWTSDKAKYDAVPSPVIPGYTVDVATVPSEAVTQENIVKDVHYTIQTQKVTYTVVDETTGQTLENQVELTTGDSGAALPAAAQTKYDRIVKGYTDKGYELVSKDDLPAQFDKDSSVDQNVVVHLKHKVTTSSEIKTVKETIHYVYQNGSEARSSYGTSLSFTREVKTDEVTKLSTKGSWSPVTGTFAAVTSPMITGYTADKPIVAAVDGITGDSEDIVETVVYKANQERAQVRYIDDTTGATLETKELTGDYNTTDSYRTADTISHYTSQGYELVSDNYPSTGVIYNETYQKFEVHLKHGTAESQESKKVSLTVRYHGAGSQTPADNVQTATWTRTVTKDKVTGDVVKATDWTADKANYNAIPSPVIPGYTVDVATVPQEKVTQEDIVKDVHYGIQTQKVTYTVIDDTTGTTLENQVELTTGESDSALPAAAKTKYGQVVKGYTDKGYELVSKDELPAKFDTDSSVDQNVVVHLKHGTTDSQESKKVSLTVRYHGAGSQTPADNVQTATWIRTVTKDKVTGDVVKTTDWVADKATYDAVPSPVIPGYTVDVATVSAETVTQEDMVKDVYYTAIPVTPDKPTPPVVPSTSDKPTTPTVVPTTPTKATPTKTEILPSTGDSQVGPTLATLTGVSLLLSAFGYIGRRKKED
ncbi:mucin-binding protein [Streptococcus periodonticum]|uniref:mucin-binding protein n=1 Tax=Streptococcus periodonticum TaxID=2490633 RepID=UPI00157F86E9|nr:YSIRK-type signal peptide-containing protein [Streptococcus periodonticum]